MKSLLSISKRSVDVVKNETKLQSRVRKLLLQFVVSEQCGHVSAPPPNATAVQMSSGFESNHMFQLLSYCVHCLSPNTNASNSPFVSEEAGGRRRGTSDGSIPLKTTKGTITGISPLSHSLSYPPGSSVRAVEIVLDTLHEMSLPWFLSLVRQSTQGANTIW